MRIGIGHPGGKEKVTGHVLGDFSKADSEWLNPLLEAIADNTGLLTNNEDASFMNKIALATGNTKETPTKKPKAQSHIHKARDNKPKRIYPNQDQWQIC